MTSNTATRPVITLSAALQAGTRDAHARLDAAPGLRQLLSPRLSYGEYADALQALSRAWGPLEAGLVHRLNEDPSRPLHQTAQSFFIPRQPALMDDLKALGRSIDTHAEPEPVDLQILGSESDSLLIAYLYVLLGGQLGSVHLERAVTRRLPNAPVNFLASRFEDLDDRWRAFQGWVDLTFTDPSEHRATIAIANRIFDVVQHCIEEFDD